MEIKKKILVQVDDIVKHSKLNIMVLWINRVFFSIFFFKYILFLLATFNNIK